MLYVRVSTTMYANTCCEITLGREFYDYIIRRGVLCFT